MQGQYLTPMHLGPSSRRLCDCPKRVRSFGRERCRQLRIRETIPRRLLLRMCNLEMTTTLASGGIWGVPGKSTLPDKFLLGRKSTFPVTAFSPETPRALGGGRLD